MTIYHLDYYIEAYYSKQYQMVKDYDKQVISIKW